MKRPVPNIDGEEDPLAQLIEQIAIKNKLNQKRKISEKKFSFSTISDSIISETVNPEIHSQLSEQEEVDSISEEHKAEEPKVSGPFSKMLKTFVTMNLNPKSKKSAKGSIIKLIREKFLKNAKL